MNNTKKDKMVSGALAFITLMGIVSLFSDMTHEGAGKHYESGNQSDHSKAHEKHRLRYL